MADWRDSLNPNAYQSPNVPPQEPIVATESIRVAGDGGGDVVPTSNTNGLYAIYGRKNPHSDRAAMLSRAAQQPGGTGINFAAPIAAFMAGREQSKADAFEKDKAEKVDAFMKQKEAYDIIKNNRDARQSNAKYLADTVFPAAQQEYISVLKDSKDEKAASAAAAKVANQMAADQGIPAPEVVAFNAWKGATTFAVRNEKGEISTAVYKDGAMKVQDKKGNFNVPDEKWMSVKDLADMMDAEAKTQRSMSSGLKGKEHIYLTAKGEVLHSTDPEAAKKQGAIKVMLDVNDEDGVKATKEFFLPGMAPKEETKTEAPAASSDPAPQQQPWASASGNSATPPTAKAPAAQPQSDQKRAEAISYLEKQKAKLTEANIAYVMGQLK